MEIVSFLNKLLAFKDRVAVVDENGQYTYGELIKSAQVIAANLKFCGVTSGDRVVIDLDKTKEHVACFIGIMLLGAAAVPLHFDYPQDRKDYIAKDSNAKLIIKDEFISSLDKNLTFDMQPVNEDLEAFLLYTSGSTGNPKGVIHTHRSMFGMIEMKANYFNEVNDYPGTIFHFSIISPFTFVASWDYMFSSFLMGSECYIAPTAITKDINDQNEFFRKNKIDFAYCSPKIANFILSNYKGLKMLIVGSERVSNVYSATTKILNLYGSSEAMIGTASFVVDKNYDNTPIGKSPDCIKTYILDDDNNEVEEGELCITGYLFKGYNNLPEQTKKVRYDNPFKDKDGYPDLYRMGDIVKKDSNGDYIYVNRKDWMIKINGQRVEPLEIECVLKGIKGITDAAVKDFVGPNGQTFVTGYYVTKENIDEDLIYAELRKKLADYMVPAYLVKLDALPKNLNGKFDRKALKMPSLSNLKQDYVEPSTELEKKLANAFEKILKINKVGKNDDFFLLGGDSIKSMELQCMLKSENLSTKVIYEGRTVGGIALLVDGNKTSVDYVHEDKEFYKLSSPQLGVYLDLLGDMKSLKYNNPFLFKLDDSIDLEKLKVAIKGAFENHDSYRCVIKEKDGMPVMFKKDFAVNFEQFSGQIDNVSKTIVTPFDLQEGPLYRIAFINDNKDIYLFFDFHHLVFDGTSFSVLAKEIEALYKGEQIEKEDVSIFDIQSYEEKMEATVEYKHAEEVFDQDFNGAECQNSFATDFDSETNTADEINSSTDGLINFDTINDYIKSKGITENTLFLSVFLYTLSIFNGDDKAFVCVGENGRHNARLSSTGGMFVRNIPLNYDLSSFHSFTDLLFDVENKFRKYVNNDIYPFAKLAKKYGFNNSFTFVYQGDNFNYLKIGDKKYYLSKIKVDSALANIELMAFKGQDNFYFNFTYRSDLYHRSVMESFMNTYLQVLSEVLTKDDLSDISLLSEKSKQKLDEINARDVGYEDVSVVDLFNKSVSKYGNNIAVCYKENKYTYLEANIIANKIANYILSLKLTGNKIGAIMIPRNEYMLLATLGVIKAGFGFQPLDTSYPQDRLNFMVNDSEASILITTKELRPLLNEYHGEVLYLEDIPSLTNDKDPGLHIDPHDVFVMLYTSGTTGKPKGVILEHKNFVCFYKYDTKISNIDSSTRQSCYASYGFDASVRDLFAPICVGGASYIVPEDIRLDLEALEKFYIDNQITNGVITTQVGRKFYQAVKSPYMRSLMVGGEKLVPVYINDTFELVNGYGPTETTVYITSAKVDKLYKRVPIGKVNDNNKAYVVDKNMRLLPFGAPGELVISGDQVARGYHKRDDANKKAFITNPFSTDTKYQRMYKTGDVVRLFDDGVFDFIGRNDGQVKIRGFRVELSEVEKIIREFRGIKDAAVVAFDKPSGGKFIAAYLVSDSEIDIKKLKEFILKNKPSYMVPEAIMQIDKIPLNQNQKLNKRALPVPTFNQNKEKAETSHSDSFIVSKLKELVKEITGDDSASYEDDLFNFGLTSITLMELSSGISKLFNVSISIKDLLEDCSFKHIEELIIIALMSKKEAKEIKENDTQKEYPLSETQNGLYVEYIKDKTSLNYNVPFCRVFSKEKYSDLTVDKLKKSLVKVFDAHQCLKSTITSNKDNQIVMLPHYVDDVHIETLKGSVEEFEKYKAEFVKPFELEKSVYRVSIFEADQIYLLMDVHHIMFDGASMTVLMHDLDSSLNGKDIIKEDYSVYDVATDEKELLKSDALESAKTYYDNLLADLDGSTQIIEECYIKDSSKADSNIVIDADLSSIKKYIDNKGLSENAFFLGCFGIFLNKYTYNDISCFTTVYNGRNDLKKMNTIGMLVKTLPFVTNTTSNPSVDEFFTNSKSQILNNMANDIYSFAKIAKENNISTDLMFVYQGKYEESDIYGLPLKDVKSPISIELRNDDKKLYFHVEYDEGKYSTQFIERLIKAYSLVCKNITSMKYVNDVCLTNEEDKTEIIKLVTNDVPYDETPIISIIEKRMTVHPEKTAVICENDSLTYAELDRLSKNIAGYISSLGIKNEDVVSVMVPRSVYMVLCSIGVLRSGAGYQPLDQSYPKDRLNFMIADSGAKLLITSHELRDLVDGYQGNVLYVEDIKSLKDVDVLNVTHNIHDKFIMLYTSGTTGTPKGVILENINLSCMTSCYMRARNMDENMVVSSYASFGFDACMLDFYPTLINGGTIHVISEDLRLNFPKLVEYIEDNKLTYTVMTTQVGRQIATTSKSKYLKAIGMGGEKLVPFDPSDVPFEVYNMYGPSETTSYSNEALVDKLYRRIPVGKANQNLHVYVVDKNLKLLPIGSTGELIIAGKQVGRGYLNRPEKTASVFIKNPIVNDEKYIQAYRTGDVVRMLEDGSIDFIGRNDGQVKVRGFRIELSEVEEIIRRYPGIKDATTNAYDDPAGGKFIAAYIVADTKIDINDMNKFIASEKPAYIVPKVTMQIDKIPLNVNSKVDKRKLPAPDLSTLQNDYVEPANELEKEFCEVFASILGLKKVGATDDFFALGGSSIGAAQIVGHAFTKGYDIVFKNVFENSTPRALSEFVAKSNNITLENKEEPKVEEFKEIIEPEFKENVISNLGDINKVPLGGVVLLGATGFLGMHVLKELLDHSDEKVYCVIRENDINQPLQRLLIMLEYYFENTYEDLLDKRLFVIKGDLLDEHLGDKLEGLDYHTIINCAASVKHFAKDDSIHKTNAGGVANLINIALKTNKKLVHISTLSVAGESVNGNIPHGFKMKETMLNFGQNVDNKYVGSKFDAEEEIKEAISQGLKAKIIRVGNLMSRHSDGEFQINFYSNNFMNTFRAFQLMQCIPYDNLIQNIEFSQIDLVAKAIVLLSQTEDKFNVFHVNNAHYVQMNNVVEEMNKNNIVIKRVSNEEFFNKLNEVIEKTSDTQTMNSLLAYRTNKNEKRFFIDTDNSFTLEVLYRMGFVWPLPDSEYLEKLINCLIGLDFFERKD